MTAFCCPGFVCLSVSPRAASLACKAVAVSSVCVYDNRIMIILRTAVRENDMHMSHDAFARFVHRRFVRECRCRLSSVERHDNAHTATVWTETVDYGLLILS